MHNWRTVLKSFTDGAVNQKCLQIIELECCIVKLTLTSKVFFKGEKAFHINSFINILTLF